MMHSQVDGEEAEDIAQGGGADTRMSNGDFIK